MTVYAERCLTHPKNEMHLDFVIARHEGSLNHYQFI